MLDVGGSNAGVSNSVSHADRISTKKSSRATTEG